MYKLSLIMVFCLLISLIQAQEKFIARIDNPHKDVFKSISKEKVDILGYHPGKFIDILLNETEIAQLKSKGYNLYIYQTEDDVKQNLIAGKALNGYRTYNDLLTELQQIETNNPGICKLYDIGNSQGKEYYTGGNSSYLNYNHEVWALKISDNVLVEEDEPSVFYFGVHHAREPISLEVSMYVLNYIITNYGTDPDITSSVNNKQIWFVPLVNPNGHKIVTDEADLWWRKNIHDNNSNGILDISGSPDGVDPNRNYGWEWGGQGSSGDIYNDTYRGTSPFSEPETQAVKSLWENHHFVTGITYHSYSELVLYPYGYASSVVAPDQDALEELAVDMALTIPADGGGNYTPQASWQLYPATGVTDDYAYGQHGIFCYTIELGTEFIPPANEVDGICQDNLQAALILLNRVEQSTLTGLVKDANSLNPVVAEIYIEGIDNSGVYREAYLSDATFGRYYRLLQDGIYNVTFSAYGYISQTFSSVNINNSGQTILDVYLVQAQTVSISGTVTDLDTGLPIENATIEILNTPISPVLTNSNGEYTILDMMEGTYTFRVFAADYATISQSLDVSVTNTVFDFQLQESFAWSFEIGSFEPAWEFSGNEPWTVVTENPYDGIFCAKSGVISDEETSVMETTLQLTSGGDVSFFRKVSTEASYDFLRFYIDDVLQDEWSGELDWSEVSYPVTIGIHTFKWSYDKDQSVANGSDCGWVDYIIFPPLAPLPDPAEIDLSQLSFDVTLSQDDMLTEQLIISNLGDLNLDFNITRQYEAGKAKAYCTAGGGCDEYISRVVFNTIDQTSGCDGYADYTGVSTSVDPGQSYDITVENGTVYSTDDLGVLIDWNQDTDFDDAGENVVCESANSGQGTYSITVPLDAIAGQTRMRIRIKYSGSDCGSPCGTTQYGEVEDYSVFVNGSFTDWLSISPISGSVTGLDNAIVDFSINSTDLDEGDYVANVTIASNDMDEPQLIVPCTLHVENGTTVQLKAFLEGPFESSVMSTTLNTIGLLPLSQPFNSAPWNYSGAETVSSLPANAVDWILIELRETSGLAATAVPSSIVAQQAGFLLSDGTVINIEENPQLRFNISINDNLYIVLWQRNHLGVMSAAPLVKSGGVFEHDFTISNGQAYGTDAQKEVGLSVWGLISGDVNSDGDVNNDDKTLSWENDAGTAGFYKTDINLDGQVDNKDKLENWLPNDGRGCMVPE